jgi:hypothetical protein
LDRLHIRGCVSVVCGGDLDGAVGCWLVVTGSRCPLTKPAVTADRTSCRPSSSVAAEARSPAVFARVLSHREPTPGRPGLGWRRGRRRFLFLWPSYRPGSVYTHNPPPPKKDATPSTQKKDARGWCSGVLLRLAVCKPPPHPKKRRSRRFSFLSKKRAC